MIGSIHEECGVFGIYSKNTVDAAHEVYLGLYALQHRGQESVGISVCDDGIMRHRKGAGLVHEVFGESDLQALGAGNIAVGHVRYSTTGGGSPENFQPLVVRHIKGNMSLAHNGNLTNAEQLRRKFELNGAIFHGTSDTEAIAYSIVAARLKCGSTEEAVELAMNDIKGAYSCVLMTATKLIAFRDPNGFRPLVLGKTDGGYIAASESCAIESVGGTVLRDVKPGEIVVIGADGLRSIETHCGNKQSLCVFECIYFARPDSVIEGMPVHEWRMNAGKALARSAPADADIVIGVPDSGIDAALGYSAESGIPYATGFVKNRYIGRSFIQPKQSERRDAVRIKLNAVASAVAGKRVVMVDDSIVRGTTSARIVGLLRSAGAKEVHVRISSPPFRFPCYFGTDIDSQENLIACRFTDTAGIAKAIGADSLAYLSVEDAKALTSCDICDGCFTGDYPADVSGCGEKNKFEEKIHKSN
ncbi:MAG: amidophosphoribosyltransferase [Ruminiclostridium sp.]|nr:amidophosphoribosyltransferase [Ruminiclostridium sp.]